jgi:hypothetical protein
MGEREEWIMKDCQHERWETQLFYGSGGTQIHCEVVCEDCEQKAPSSNVTHDGKILTIKPNWDMKYGGETGFEINEN